MEFTFLGLGIALVLNSILGGGVKAFSIEIPKITSKKKSIAILLLGLLSIGAWCTIKFINMNEEKTIIDTFSYNKVEIGWDFQPYGQLNIGNLTYNNIKAMHVDNNLILLAYEYLATDENKLMIGDMAFQLKGNRLSGFFRDLSNSSLQPGKMQLIFNTKTKTAVGWWTDGKNEKKYNAYLRLK